VDAWKSCESVSPVTTAISVALKKLVDDQQEVHRLSVYDKSGTRLPQIPFSLENQTLDNKPPREAVLPQNLRRAANQAGHVWGPCLPDTPALPWESSARGFRPLWTKLPEDTKRAASKAICSTLKYIDGERVGDTYKRSFLPSLQKLSPFNSSQGNSPIDQVTAWYR
jgi:hypothetical protein